MLFNSFGSYWIFGYSIPEVTSIVIDSDNQCVKYEGEVRECTEDDILFIKNLKNNYTKNYVK